MIFRIFRSTLSFKMSDFWKLRAVSDISAALGHIFENLLSRSMIFLDVLIAFPPLSFNSLSLLFIAKLKPAPAVLGLVMFLFYFCARVAGGAVPGTLSAEEPWISGNFSE